MEGMLTRAPAAVEESPADDLDGLAGLALEYRARSVRFINGRPAVGQGAGPISGLEAAETVLWFSSRIYFTTTRALVGKALTAAGQPNRSEDASLSAGQALVAVDRSRAALQQLQGEEDERRTLVALLDAIALGIGQRFPGTVRQKETLPRATSYKKGARLISEAGSQE
jgi:hypothetical protein